MNWKLKALALGVGLLMTTTAQAGNVNVKGTHVHDTYKDVIKRQPYNESNELEQHNRPRVAQTIVISMRKKPLQWDLF